MMKKMVIVLAVLSLFPEIPFLKISLESYYPKILSLNSDSVNEVLFLRYRNDEGNNIYLKIFDVNYVLIYEEKISPTVEEVSIGDYYIYPVRNLRDKLSAGIYIFVLVSGNKIVSKGSFIVAK